MAIVVCDETAAVTMTNDHIDESVIFLTTEDKVREEAVGIVTCSTMAVVQVAAIVVV